MTPMGSWPHTHHDVLQHYWAQYDKAIASGDFEPFLYPQGAFGTLGVVLYLLIPHQDRSWVRSARSLAFAWIAGFAAYCVKYTRAKNMAPAFGLGLISAWSVIWVLTILIVNDSQADFQRIQRTEGVFRRSEEENEAQFEEISGVSSSPYELEKPLIGVVSNSPLRPKERLWLSKRHGEYAWQPYPLTPFIERLDWVADMFFNFKGMNWNWRIPTLPPPPKHIQEQLHRNSHNPPKHSFRRRPGQTHIYTMRKELLIASFNTLLKAYICLDVIKTIMNHDPYFWGFVDRPPPPHFPSFLHQSPKLVHMYRLTVSQFAIKYSLQASFALAPLFFSGVLGPSIIGTRAEAWMYPEDWGSYVVVLDRGIAGWWSGWWHQTFQFAFTEPSRKIIELSKMDSRTPVAKSLQLIIAFTLSGTLHACGSYTQPGNTRPILGPIRFFLLQALGIFIEGLTMQAVRKTGTLNSIPKLLMRAFTFVYVHIWFYNTAHLICDDFAKGGIWLYEPIPFSVLRGLGFGVEGDKFWCWSGEWVRWVNGNEWWTSGIAF